MSGKKFKPGVLVRLRAANVLLAITRDKLQLDEALQRFGGSLSKQDQSLLRAMVYGVMRWYIALEFWLEKLTRRQASKIDAEVAALIMLGLYQLKYMRIPAHAAIHATVDCTVPLKCARAKGLVNAALRQFQRALATDENDSNSVTERQPDAVHYSHPEWMLNRFREDWPDDWQQIVVHNNLQAPMTLRVDAHQTTVIDYQARLQAGGIQASTHALATDALVLDEPVDIQLLPGFQEGLVSVQDAAAQMAVPLMQIEQAHHVLDACAAPGGKTAHLLQKARPASLVALDNSERRLEDVASTLARIDQQAGIICGDASQPSGWWNKQQFDRILLDAPCSASGVIRRHPDIKYLRSEDALEAIILRQQKIMDALWQLLKSGGMLLYVTCSVFRAENQEQIKAFLQRHSDAELSRMPADWGRGKIGRQILPGDDNMDGFYFALLSKR